MRDEVTVFNRAQSVNRSAPLFSLFYRRAKLQQFSAMKITMPRIRGIRGTGGAPIY